MRVGRDIPSDYQILTKVKAVFLGLDQRMRMRCDCFAMVNIIFLYLFV